MPYQINMKFYTVALALIFGVISGCSSKPLVVGKPGEAVSSEEVTIYFIKRPACEFETIAHLTLENPYYSLQSLVSAMRFHAAELGAEAIYVEQTQRLPGREYIGTGRAIRCADQTKA